MRPRARGRPRPPPPAHPSRDSRSLDNRLKHAGSSHTRTAAGSCRPPPPWHTPPPTHRAAAPRHRWIGAGQRRGQSAKSDRPRQG
eukprot:scaffold1576_cov102-Isochrysis_galbana.AAC.5